MVEQRAAPVVIALNASVVAFVDELLRLSSAAVASTVVELLFGRERQAPPALLGHVNGGIHVPLADLLASRTPLAIPIADRLRVSSTWRVGTEALKAARALARARYRDLQAAFVASGQGATVDSTAALLRYTFGSEGRQWLWEEVAGRVLHRVCTMNRAALELLAAAGRGQQVELPGDAATLALADFDLPAGTLDLLAAALPPVVVPDWTRIARAVAGSAAALRGEEAVARYRSLLAEILGREEARP